jgi:glycosyltransferase involved in cell wall biosynthesis
MATVKVSVIVPVYNVEKYLKKCLDSILTQTFNDFECILVDDASPDNCPVLCDEYAKIDNRIKVIHKLRNGGLPQARKTGFDLSGGDYILFVDSDDWIEKDMLEKMCNAMNKGKFDMVYADFFQEKESSTEYIKLGDFTNDKIHNLKIILEYRPDTSVWNKLVKREIYKKIVFPREGYGEDKCIMAQALYYTDTIGYINHALYHYRIRHDSWMRDKTKEAERCHDAYLIFIFIVKFLHLAYGKNLDIFEPQLSIRINNTKSAYINNLSQTKNFQTKVRNYFLSPPKIKMFFIKKYLKRLIILFTPPIIIVVLKKLLKNRF